MNNSGDIVTRLRRWTHAVDAAPASDLMDEAAREIERLRGDAEASRLRLTDEEREAIENCIYASVRIGDDWSDKQAATLRGLLERLR